MNKIFIHWKYLYIVFIKINLLTFSNLFTFIYQHTFNIKDFKLFHKQYWLAKTLKDFCQHIILHVPIQISSNTIQNITYEGGPYWMYHVFCNFDKTIFLNRKLFMITLLLLFYMMDKSKRTAEPLFNCKLRWIWKTLFDINRDQTQ